MTVLRTLNVDAECGPNFCGSQSFSSLAIRSGAPLSRRNGGVSVLGGAIDMVAVDRSFCH